MNEFRQLIEYRSLANKMIACLKGMEKANTRFAKIEIDSTERIIEKYKDYENLVDKEKGYVEGIRYLLTQSETILEFLKSCEEKIIEIEGGDNDG